MGPLIVNPNASVEVWSGWPHGLDPGPNEKKFAQILGPATDQ